MTIQAGRIKEYILQNIEHHPEHIVAVAAQHFTVTRTTIHRHLSALLQQGQIVRSGTTRNSYYRLKSSAARQNTYKIDASISEFAIFDSDFADLYQPFANHVYDLCVYGFTAMLNNAIVHSGGSHITVSTAIEEKEFLVIIKDNGPGIFQTLTQHFSFSSLPEAVLQLSKGKLTTGAHPHKGEGIFFTSRAWDRFEIFANQLHYIRDNRLQDWSLETLPEKMQGTAIHMRIHPQTSTTLMDVFKCYQHQNDAAFSRTEILVMLSQWGNTPLVSREQAAQVIAGLEKFHHVTLDFSGVRLVGQGFVDEVFRVFQNRYPDIVIESIHANNDVSFMIKRCLG